MPRCKQNAGDGCLPLPRPFLHSSKKMDEPSGEHHGLKTKMKQPLHELKEKMHKVGLEDAKVHLIQQK